jgi:hypothetical protein
MNMDTHRYTCELTAFLAAAAFFVVVPAHADYVFSTVDYPGVDYAAGGSTQLNGISSDGVAVGTAQINASSPTFSFRYDSKRNVFTALPNYHDAKGWTLAEGINSLGTVVGSESQDGGTKQFAFVLKDGSFELLSRPGSSTFTQARAVNAQGHISGYALNDSDGTYSGFIYDPESNVWTDVLPSQVTIAQGLNNRDELVGNVYENAGIVCAACQPGPYGFIRAPGGFVAVFAVNGHPTDARGVTDADMITGFVWLDNSSYAVGFVIAKPASAGFQTVSVLAKDFLRVPDSTQTFPEGISDDGTLAGLWMDKSGATHGFIAAPGSKE